MHTDHRDSRRSAATLRAAADFPADRQDREQTRTGRARAQRVAAPGMLLALLCTSASALAQGAVFDVAPNGPLTDIQAAVDAAGNGDLVKVAPGVYPGFSIVGKQVAVVGVDPLTDDPATYTVAAAAGTPAIRIEQLLGNQLVTVSGARIQHTDQLAPAIVVTDNLFANVRLQDIVVTTATGLGNVPYSAVIEARDTGSLWLDRVECGDHRTYGNTISGSGLAALLCDTTPVHTNRCDLRGLRSANPLAAGGDGLQLKGLDGTAWLVDTVLYGGMSAAGAVPLSAGGHAIHDFDGLAGKVTACDCTLEVSVSTVPQYAIAGGPAALPVCDDRTIGRTELTPFASSLRIGSSATVSVSANVTNRAFLLVIDDGFGHFQLTSLFAGTMLFSGGEVPVTAGLLGASGYHHSLQLPFVPGAVGMHVTLQSALLEPAGVAPQWSLTSAAGFTVR